MRHLKHDFIANFKVASPSEKKEMLMDEISKAILLFPKAITDVLDGCGIFYESDSANHLMKAIQENVDDLRMMNRVVRISILVNKDGTNTYDSHRRGISHRNLMRKGTEFLKSNKETIQDAVLLSQTALCKEAYNDTLKKSVNVYLNMDGDGEEDDAPEQQQKEIKSKEFGANQALIGFGIFLVLLYALSTNKKNT